MTMSGGVLQVGTGMVEHGVENIIASRMVADAKTSCDVTPKVGLALSPYLSRCKILMSGRQRRPIYTQLMHSTVVELRLWTAIPLPLWIYSRTSLSLVVCDGVSF